MSALTQSPTPALFTAPGPQIHFALRALALILLFSAAAVYESTHLSSLNSSEVWVHLRTGTWMLENRAIPRTGLFSQSANLPWNDSSWGFDLLLAMAYRVFGLRAVPILLMLLKSALAIVVFLLARSGCGGFWRAVALSALAQYVIALQPLPYVCSILFLAIELLLLLSSRHSGSMRRLFWLPLLFLLWANLHLQFVAGLLLLALFVIAVSAEHGLTAIRVQWLSPRILPLPLRRVIAIAALSLLATSLTPYGFRLIPMASRALYSDVALKYFSEMTSMPFRHPQDYLVMLLVMMAFLALGRRRSLELFELLMLAAGTALAFRIQRDAWMAVLPAIAVLSRNFSAEPRENDSTRVKPHIWQWSAIAAVTAAVLVIAAARLPDRNVLMNRVSQNFPVKACEYIRSNNLPHPLFNEYSWGSFLTWYLPQYPVVADSRVDLYGDEILSKYFDVVGGKERLDAEPMVARAGTLLLERNSAMTKALMNLPALRSQYRLVYSDERASVFVSQRAVSSEQ